MNPLGGEMENDENTITEDPLGTRDFFIIVPAAPQAIPEPATMFLLATGLGGAALAQTASETEVEKRNQRLKFGAG